MESLDCRTPSRCRTCEHVAPGGACGLEADVDAALDALATQRTRILVAAGDAWRARA